MAGSSALVPPPSTSRRCLFRAIAAVLALGCLEISSCFAIPALERELGLVASSTRDLLAVQASKLDRIVTSQDSAILQLDAELGWRYGPDRQSVLYTANSRGARGRREYPLHPPPGTVRVAAFGDSYVHGNEVSDADAWASVIEDMDRHMEVLNFGVGGYGTDQSLLRYRRHAISIDADVVILGFSSTNYARNLNRYRPFLSPRDLPLFKPRFRLDAHDRLEQIPPEVAGVGGARQALGDMRQVVVLAGDGDFFYSPLIWENPLYDHFNVLRLVTATSIRVWRSKIRRDRLWVDNMMNPACEGLALLEQIVRTFHAEATAGGSRFLFLLFPGRDSNIWNAAPAPSQPILDALKDLPVEDLTHTIREAFSTDQSALFAPGGHYSTAGNLEVAKRVHAIIQGKLLPSNPGSGPTKWASVSD